MTIKTDYPINFSKAENETFSWNGSYGEFLFHKASKRSIYQMTWTDTKEPVEPETKAAAIEFWNELSNLQKAETERKWNADSFQYTDDYRRMEALEAELDSEDSIH